MRTQPFRPGNDITQGFRDGLVTIYRTEDAAQPGYQPREQLTEVAVLRYEERKMGLQRFFSAQQNQIRVERVLRVPKSVLIHTQDVAITEDGRRYSIELAQLVPDVRPLSVDLTLRAIEQSMDRGEEETHDVV